MQRLLIAIAPMHQNLLSVRIGDQVCQNILGRCPNAHGNGVALLVAAGVMALIATGRIAVHHLEHHTALIPTASSGRPAPTRLILIMTPVTAMARFTVTNLCLPAAVKFAVLV